MLIPMRHAPDPTWQRTTQLREILDLRRKYGGVREEDCLALIDQGIDLRPSTWLDSSLLHMAAAAHVPACITALCERGAPTDAVDRDGATALHIAAAGRHLPSVEALIAAGSAVNARGLHGRTPLMGLIADTTLICGGQIAAISRDTCAVATHLIAAGANLQHGDAAGRPPLTACADAIAPRRRDGMDDLMQPLASVLLRSGADLITALDGPAYDPERVRTRLTVWAVDAMRDDPALTDRIRNDAVRHLGDHPGTAADWLLRTADSSIVQEPARPRRRRPHSMASP
jgi:hypothetical protein